MKRVLLFFVMSVVSSTSLFCMDEKNLERDAAQESARILLNGIFSELRAQGEQMLLDSFEKVGRNGSWEINGGIVPGLISEISHLCFTGDDNVVYRSSESVDDILASFEEIDDSKPIYFTEPDGTTSWVSSAWLK